MCRRPTRRPQPPSATSATSTINFPRHCCLTPSLHLHLFIVTIDRSISPSSSPVSPFPNPHQSQLSRPNGSRSLLWLPQSSDQLLCVSWTDGGDPGAVMYYDPVAWWWMSCTGGVGGEVWPMAPGWMPWMSLCHCASAPLYPLSASTALHPTHPFLSRVETELASQFPASEHRTGRVLFW